MHLSPRHVASLLCENAVVGGIRRIFAFYDIPAVKFVTRSAVHLALLLQQSGRRTSAVFAPVGV